MGRISIKIERCDRCRMHKELCICNLMPTLDLKTKLVLIMHKKEYVKISATAPLALECLPNSELLIHGFRANPLDLNHYNDKNRRKLFLFPAQNARVLSKELIEEDERPITLFVPDGNWAQATKMSRRLPGIETTEMVKLPPGQKTRWGLRKEFHEDGLATFEAMARAIGIIETPTGQKQMETLFDKMVQIVSTLRGTKQRL